MQTKHLIRAAIGFLIYFLMVPIALFVSAGTTRWTMGWLYVILLLVSTFGSRLIVLKRNPDTLRERARFISAEGTKAWDRILVMIVGLLGPLATVIVAGLDQRLGWSVLVPRFGQHLAALLVAGGMVWRYGQWWRIGTSPRLREFKRIGCKKSYRLGPIESCAIRLMQGRFSPL